MSFFVLLLIKWHKIDKFDEPALLVARKQWISAHLTHEFVIFFTKTECSVSAGCWVEGIIGLPHQQRIFGHMGVQRHFGWIEEK